MPTHDSDSNAVASRQPIDVDWRELRYNGELEDTIYLADGLTSSSAVPGEHVGLRWKFETQHQLYRTMKRARAQWTCGLWSMDQATAAPILEAIRARGDLQVVPYRERSDLRGLPLELTALGRGFWRLDWDLDGLQARQATPGINAALAGCRIRALCTPARPAEIFALLDQDQARALCQTLRREGAGMTLRHLPRAARRALREPPVQIEVHGWMVNAIADPTNPVHWRLMPSEPEGNRRRYSNPEPWNGALTTTRSGWPDLRRTLEELGVPFVGSDPENTPLRPSCTLDPARVPGWDAPATNGYQLREYQRDAVRFLAGRGLRALLGDEMGLGKCAEAIGAARGTGVKRTLIICPASARSTWESEIRGWSAPDNEPRIQHIHGKHATVDPDAHWIICTYDQLALRTEYFGLPDGPNAAVAMEEITALLDRDMTVWTQAKSKNGKQSWKIKISTPITAEPECLDPKDLKRWRRIMYRLRQELIVQLEGWNPQLVIADETHALKNPHAKRTRAVARLVPDHRYAILITGTPIMNHEREAMSLLSLLDPQAREIFRSMMKTNRCWGEVSAIDAVREYLDHLMLRRLKQDILPELPPKVRQRMHIRLMPEDPYIKRYAHTMLGAARLYYQTLRDTQTPSTARAAARAQWQVAARLLGLGKAADGQAAELIREIVLARGAVIVVTVHRDVTDCLARQLRGDGLRVVTLDGRVPMDARADVVNTFQRGGADVIIGSIRVAGESITLTRADTVVFVELDWVPARLLQAEDRGHRLGQQAASYHIIHLVADLRDHDELNIDEAMISSLTRKIAVIKKVLDHAEEVIADPDSEHAEDWLFRRFLERPPPGDDDPPA